MARLMAKTVIGGIEFATRSSGPFLMRNSCCLASRRPRHDFTCGRIGRDALRFLFLFLSAQDGLSAARAASAASRTVAARAPRVAVSLPARAVLRVPVRILQSVHDSQPGRRLDAALR